MKDKAQISWRTLGYVFANPPQVCRVCVSAAPWLQWKMCGVLPAFLRIVEEGVGTCRWFLVRNFDTREEEREKAWGRGRVGEGVVWKNGKGKWDVDVWEELSERGGRGGEKMRGQGWRFQKGRYIVRTLTGTLYKGSHSGLYDGSGNTSFVTLFARIHPHTFHAYFSLRSCSPGTDPAHRSVLDHLLPSGARTLILHTSSYPAAIRAGPRRLLMFPIVNAHCSCRIPGFVIFTIPSLSRGNCGAHPWVWNL